MSETYTGTVKQFGYKGKKFGLIRPDEVGKDMFVHKANVLKSGLSTLVVGQRVSYKIAKDRTSSLRPTAVGLRVFDAAPANGDICEGVVTFFSWDSQQPHGFIHLDALGPVAVYVHVRQFIDVPDDKAIQIAAGARLRFKLRQYFYQGNLWFRAQQVSLSSVLTVPRPLVT